MSLRIPMIFEKDDTVVHRMVVPAGYTTFHNVERLIDDAISELFSVEIFLARFGKPSIPEWDVIRLQIPGAEDVLIGKQQFINVNIWRGLLAAGAEPDHVFTNIRSYIGDLKLHVPKSFETEVERLDYLIGALIAENFLANGPSIAKQIASDNA